MSKSSNSRVVVFLGVIGLTALVWLLRGVGLLTFIPGFVLWTLILLTLVLAIVNGLIETR
ncbi:hypothetical protein C7B65_11780 [Phormidesmis priestleyi ULC007]|uniref:DUF4175 domain-containing protein n=1 Tax=Phormidesmis priestleyi ULC007 TaxID=1920490 RepID=A0A2T1DFL1_9CYAN|nr:hypothetical protein [Phormidesmis priestleyi]PSB19247.1 hypothetical protein C7B65_11780 [Phormidesmis priestleyi ULC007]PZO48202.1 MAG: hypothetical protein DCF14_17900 [Phormidesmis priestleyi]